MNRKERIKQELEKLDKAIQEISSAWPYKRTELVPGHGYWLSKLFQILLDLVPENQIPLITINYAKLARKTWEDAQKSVTVREG